MVRATQVSYLEGWNKMKLSTQSLVLQNGSWDSPVIRKVDWAHRIEKFYFKGKAVV